MPLVIFAAACAVGQFLQTTVGFGLNVLIMAVAAAFFPIPTLAAACSLLSMVSCAYFMFRWRRKIRLRLILWPLLSMLAVSALAILTVRGIPDRLLRGALGLALVGLSIFLLLSRRGLGIRPSVGAGIAVGGVAGVLAGYFSVGGPPMAAYLLGSTDDKETYLVNIQTMFFVSSLWTTLLRGAEGLLNAEVLRLCVVGYGCVALGAFVGTRLLHHLRFDGLRQLAYLFIGISGGWVILDAWLLG